MKFFLITTITLVLFLFGAQTVMAYTLASTNALNQASNAPGRPGQLAPHVVLTTTSVGSVTLTFKNPSVVLACFERRIDGQVAYHNNVQTNHFFPALAAEGEKVYPYFCMAAGAADRVETYPASSTVEIRHAFGPENDWYFDWTTFEVLQPPVPTDKDQCKKNGWKEYVDDNGIPFKNQGQCVSYVETRKHNPMLLETIVLDTSKSIGETSSMIFKTGKSYKFVISGTWSNRPGELVDAKFTTMDNWTNWHDAPSGGYDPKLLDVQVNDEFVDWGLYSSDHTYSINYTGDGNPVNFRVFDGDVSSETINEGWYGDNNGTLTIKIYK